MLLKKLGRDRRGILVTQFVLLSFLVAAFVFAVTLIGIAYWIREDLDDAAYSAARYMATQNRAGWPMAKRNALRAVADDLAMNPFLGTWRVVEGCAWRTGMVTACFEERWQDCKVRVTLRLQGWHVGIPFLLSRNVRIGAGHVAPIEHCP